MVDTYNDSLADALSDVSSPYSPMQAASMGDSEEPSSKEINRRLTQALEYLDDEGGDDSPATYMERIARIDDYLVHQLLQQGVSFDNALYQHLQNTVRQQLEAYDAARQSTQTVLENRESLLAGGFDAPMTHALYREDEQIYDPVTVPLRKGQKTQGTVQTRRTFKYGGPSSDAEVWHRNFPAILPFPETHQLAHWENLKIAFDLDESVKKQKAEGGVVETNVSFDHPALDQYKSLALYESGSRFKLPTPSDEINKEIKRLCTVNRIAKAVEEFNAGEEKDESGKRYAPRIFLDELIVQQKGGPTDIRRAVNASPTKPRQRVARSGSQLGSANTTQVQSSTTKSATIVSSSVAEATPAMVQTPVKLSSGKPQASLPRTRENRVAIANDLVRTAREEAQSAKKLAQAAREKARKATLDALRIADQANGKLTSGNFVSSPVARMINREREMSLEKSPRRQSGVSTAPPSAETTPTTDVVPIEESDDAPGSEPLGLDMSQLEHTPADTTTPKPSSGRTVRRKRSIGGEAYTPESKRSKVRKPPSLRKGASGKHQTPGRSVRFVSEDDSNDGSSDSTTITAGKRKRAKSQATPKPEKKMSPSPKTNLVEVSTDDASETSSSKTTAATKKFPIAKKPAAKPRTKPGGKPGNTAAVVKQESSKSAVAGKAVRRIQVKKVAREHIDVDEEMEELDESIVEITKIRGTRGGARHAK